MNKLKLHWPGCKLIGMQIFLRPAVSPPFETRPPSLSSSSMLRSCRSSLLRRTVLSFKRFYSIPPYGHWSQHLQLRLLRLVDIGILSIRRVAWLMLDCVHGYHSYPWMERERVEFKSQIRVFWIFRMTFLCITARIATTGNYFLLKWSICHFSTSFNFYSSTSLT